MTDKSPNERGVSPRVWIGVVIVILVAVFIASNTEDANVSLLFVDMTMSLWVSLTIAAVLGFVAGWLIGRRRR